MAGYGHKIIYIRQKYAYKILSWYNAHLRNTHIQNDCEVPNVFDFSKICLNRK